MCTRIFANPCVEYRTPLLEVADLCVPLREIVGMRATARTFHLRGYLKSYNFFFAKCARVFVRNPTLNGGHP